MLCRRGDGQVCYVCACLATAENKDGLVDTEVVSLLELRRVEGDGDLVYTRNLGDIGNYMKAGADGDSIALPSVLVAILFIDNRMTSTCSP